MKLCAHHLDPALSARECGLRKLSDASRSHPVVVRLGHSYHSIRLALQCFRLRRRGDYVTRWQKNRARHQRSSWANHRNPGRYFVSARGANYCSWRNHPRATDVCPSFTSCPPRKVPIRSRLKPVRLIEPATLYCCSTVAIRSS